MVAGRDESKLTNAVTGTLLDLKTVGKGLTGTEVDEVGIVASKVSTVAHSKCVYETHV